MDIEATLMEKIKRFEDLKNQITEMTKKINGLTEQRIAVYNQALELKGGIDVLVALKEKEKEDLAKDLSKSKTAGLTLPVGVQPVVPEVPVVEPVALEVK